MNATRDHHVADQAPDWRAAKPGHKAPARRMPKHVNDPLTWPVLAALAVAVVCIVAMGAAGYLP